MSYNWIQNENIQSISGKKILVAGGTGFIGKRAVHFLKEMGAKIYVLTRQDIQNTSSVTYWQVDLSDYDSLKKFCNQVFFDAAIYLAANIPLRGARKESYLAAKKSTLDPFVNFCDCFIDDINKLIYATSVDVLGINTEYEFDEDAALNLATPYGLAKYCGELYCRDICEQKGVNYMMYRFAQVYGPNEPVVRIIPIIIDALTNGTEFNLFTSGNEKRRFIYVDDAVQALIEGIVSLQKGLFNIAGNEIISMSDLVKLIENVWGIKLNYQILNKMEGKDNIPGIGKAKQLLGFEPEVSMREGLMKVKEAM